MRDAVFDHDGCTSPLVGMVFSMDAVIQKYEAIAGLEMGFLKVYDIRVPVCGKTPEFLNSRSYSIGIPRHYRQIGPISVAGIW
ncbi:hypothetical protein TNCV_3685631 [Trichonephila clavipes]|nr:hypothetical protein TNCV_3685631 [Trichonephila clavipes]